MALTQVLKKARRREKLRLGIKPVPHYTKEMKLNATGYLCIHRLVKQSISKAKILAKARIRAARVDRDVKKARGRQYYERHRKDFLNKCKKYRQTPAFKARVRKRLLHDDNFFLNTKLRRRLHTALTKSAGKKREKTMKLVGCNYDTLVDHLLASVEPGIQLRDRVVDHIFPMNAYDLTDSAQQSMCMHYSNLQLLTRTANAQKHTKLPTLELACRVERWAWPPTVSEEDLLPEHHHGSLFS